MTPEKKLKTKLQYLADRSKAVKSWRTLMITVLLLSGCCILFYLSLSAEVLSQKQFFKYSLIGLAISYFFIRLKVRRLKVSSADIIADIEGLNAGLDERLYTAFELLQKNEKLNMFERELIKEVLDHDQE